MLPKPRDVRLKQAIMQFFPASFDFCTHNCISTLFDNSKTVNSYPSNAFACENSGNKQIPC